MKKLLIVTTLLGSIMYMGVTNAAECLVSPSFEGLKHKYQIEVATEVLKKKGYTFSEGNYEYSFKASPKLYEVYSYAEEKNVLDDLYDNGFKQKAEWTVDMYDGNVRVATGIGSAWRIIVASGYGVVRSATSKAFKNLPNCSEIKKK